MATHTTNYNLSKPESTDTQSSFISDYCDNMDIIDANLGGGGGGGGNGYGAFIDVSNVIVPWTTYSGSMSYTATVDCYVSFYMVAGANITIDGEVVFACYSNNSIGDGTGIYVRKGQTIAVTGVGNNSSYAVYGLLEGSDGIFAPVIYSDTERKIGVWRDNKPLYQKTLVFSNPTLGRVDNLPHNIADVDTIFLDFWEYRQSNGTAIVGFEDTNLSWWGNFFVVDRTGLSYRIGANWGSGGDLIVNLRYTKTTDSPGSGDWNVDGSPTYTAGEGIDITSKVISLEYLTVVNGAVNLVFDDGN